MLSVSIILLMILLLINLLNNHSDPEPVMFRLI